MPKKQKRYTISWTEKGKRRKEHTDILWVLWGRLAAYVVLYDDVTVTDRENDITLEVSPS